MAAASKARHSMPNSPTREVCRNQPQPILILSNTLFQPHRATPAAQGRDSLPNASNSTATEEQRAEKIRNLRNSFVNYFS